MLTRITNHIAGNDAACGHCPIEYRRIPALYAELLRLNPGKRATRAQVQGYSGRACRAARLERENGVCSKRTDLLSGRHARVRNTIVSTFRTVFVGVVPVIPVFVMGPGFVHAQRWAQWSSVLRASVVVKGVVLFIGVRSREGLS